MEEWAQHGFCFKTTVKGLSFVSSKFLSEGQAHLKKKLAVYYFKLAYCGRFEIKCSKLVLATSIFWAVVLTCIFGIYVEILI